jgi:hypothetical protein
MPVIPALGRLREKDSKSEAMGYMVDPDSKKKCIFI